MLTTSKGANPNYLATIVQLGDPIVHPRADRLQIFLVQGCRVITDMSRKPGDVGIFFPLESKLNHELLSGLNMYEDKGLNTDITKKGYVNNKGRIRAVRLRDEPSMGLFLAWSEVSMGLGIPQGGMTINVGMEFDTWNDVLICEKYIPKRASRGEPREKSQRYNTKKFNRLVEDQFRLHADTTQLRRNMHKLSPEDLISITYKLHGTSWVVGNVMVHRELTRWEKVCRWFGAKIKETEYDIIYSSRSVVKNKFANANPNHYYGVDLWSDIKDYLDGKVPKGFTLYGEAVGYTSSGGAIQKGYDYGYKPREKFFHPDFASEQDPYRYEEYLEGKHFGVYVYRITTTNTDGKKVELSWPQIKEFCNHYGIKYVPELYYGLAGTWEDIKMEDHWHENLLTRLEGQYLEQDCTMCGTKVPAEGVVVRQDNLFGFSAYKLKSFRFLEKETKELDEEIIDLETEQHDSVSES